MMCDIRFCRKSTVLDKRCASDRVKRLATGARGPGLHSLRIETVHNA